MKINIFWGDLLDNVAEKEAPAATSVSRSTGLETPCGGLPIDCTNSGVIDR